MVSRTLGQRTKGMRLGGVKQYLDYLEQNPQAPEWDRYISAFTINHTAFFREQHHFTALAEFVRGRKKPLSIWCAAASPGEEPYSIAMTLHQYCYEPMVGVSLLATDIDATAIAVARKAVYSLERAKPVPEDLLKRYFKRGTGRQTGLVRVKSELRAMIEFDTFNLVSQNWPTQQFDAIFCRNTMIYFEKSTQIKILDRFASVLKPDGLLFAGHSENFTYLTKALRLKGQTIYELA
jgi:chemotaxis protein methyltransferase CheR